MRVIVRGVCSAIGEGECDWSRCVIDDGGVCDW